MKKGVPSVFSRMSCLRAVGAHQGQRPHPVASLLVRAYRRRVTQQRVKKLFRLRFAKGRQPQLGVVRLAAPLVAILRTIVHQQQDWPGDTLTQHIQKPLGLTVDPVQVFKDQDQRLLKALPQEQLLSASNVRRRRIWGSICCNGRLLFNPQQRKKIRQGVFQAAVEHRALCRRPSPAVCVRHPGLESQSNS